MKGEVIIGASTIPGVYLLPRIMSEFKKRYSSISFNLIISDSKKIIENVSKHKLLMGIVGTKISYEQLKYIPFVEDELIVVSVPSLIKNNRMTLNELLNLPIILREKGSGTRIETEKILKSKGVSLNSFKIAGVFPSTDAVKQAVKAGLGFSILSKISVFDELKYNILKEIKLGDIDMKRRLYIVTHRKRTLSPLYNTFLEYVLSHSTNF